MQRGKALFKTQHYNHFICQTQVDQRQNGFGVAGHMMESP